MTAAGNVYRRHDRRCPRNRDGKGYAPHRCRGTWAWHLSLGRDPVTGRRRQTTGSGYATREEALAALDEARADADITRGRGRGKTVSDWLTEWLTIDEGTEDEKSITTLARHRGNVVNHITPALGDIKLTKLTVEDVRRLMTTLRDPGYQSPVLIAKGGKKFAARRGLSSASINRVYEALHAALERAVRERLITWNPATHVKPPREQSRSYGAWSPAQTAAFLDLAEVCEHRGSAAWHVVLVTGVRRGELAGAMWHDVDLDDEVWELRENVVQVGGTTARKDPKSWAGTRLVYLDSETVGVLRAHRLLQREQRLRLGPRWVDYPHSHPDTGLPCSCDGPVFRSPRGGACKPDWFTDNWAALVDIAVRRIPGLPRIPLHGSRHTAVSAATQHVRASDQQALERFGHSSVATQRRYRHVDEELHRALAETQAALIAKHRTSRPPKAGVQ
ncbi:MAG TPA: Arm DNA-binding domain-containing protein [Jatrophihabitans sp.]|nr:Arm DNA-binding domain-containing protein [Jatrophihabitans sp.]